MLDTITHSIIYFFHCWPAEALSVITLVICGGGILGLFYAFGCAGLFVYQALAVVIGNIQVLQISQFYLFDEPMALGNVVFSTTYLVSAILTEHYGSSIAKKGVILGFLSQIWVTLFMVASLGHNPIIHTTDLNLAHMADYNYQALLKIFVPSVRILMASLIAFLIAQFFEIWILGIIRKFTGQKFIWVRQNLSMFLSGLIDTIIFTLLAWSVLSKAPLNYITLLTAYIIPATIFRTLINGLATPIIYLSYRVQKNEI